MRLVSRWRDRTEWGIIAAEIVDFGQGAMTQFRDPRGEAESLPTSQEPGRQSSQRYVPPAGDQQEPGTFAGARPLQPPFRSNPARSPAQNPYSLLHAQGQLLQNEPAPAPSAPTAVDHVGYFLREMLQIALPAIVLAIVVHLFLAQATVVYGQSMEPNLSPLQRLIVDKISYRLHSPQRNDIVVIDLPTMDDMLVKRIVGLPGETIEVRDGEVLVNGSPLPEPFPHDLGHTTMAPTVLGPLQYFVMGDNRDNSNDSRSFGPVHRESIVGRVWLRYWPLDDFTLF